MSIGGVCILGSTFAEVNNVSSAGAAYGVGEFDGICSVGLNVVDGILSDSFAEFVRICRVRKLVYEIYLVSRGAGLPVR